MGNGSSRVGPGIGSAGFHGHSGDLYLTKSGKFVLCGDDHKTQANKAANTDLKAITVKGKKYFVPADWTDEKIKQIFSTRGAYEKAMRKYIR